MYHFTSITLILFTALLTSANTELSSSVDDSGCPLWTYRHEADSECCCGTVMCILVTLFHLNTLRPPWSVFVLMAQILSASVLLQGEFEFLCLSNLKQTKAIEVEYILLATLYGPWNLDFFRALYDSICISPHITNLQSAAIDGSIGLYPLVLLCVLYSVVKLHDRGSRVFVALWKPFHILLSRFRQKLNLKSSLIDTFATFLLLSYIEISITAFYILTPTQLWSPVGPMNGSFTMTPL